MNYATIKDNDIANGLGIRVSLYVSGCTHRCKGCFNAIAWDFDYGNEFSKDVEDMILEKLKKTHIRGLTLLGGEPMETQNQLALAPFLERVKRELPQKDIWCYSGYTYEQLCDPSHRAHTPVTEKILSMLDVLVDGKFIEEQKSLKLKFRGSENQRLIDMKQTLTQNKIVLLEI